MESLLTFQGHLYIIDVSQSVDLDHPSALDFLKEDCIHVSVGSEIVKINFFLEKQFDFLFYAMIQDFFKKHGVAVMSVQELFDFVTDQTVADESVDEYLEKVWIFLL